MFIIGLGRSGSTICHKILAKHDAVAWLSQNIERRPSKPELGRLLMHAIDAPLIGQKIAQKYEPEECYGFWERYCKGFHAPCRDLNAGDVTEKSRHRIKRALAQILTKRRRRLLLKLTGWPRISYIRELFPDSIIIHIQRDPRAVVNSILQVEWWWGWQGPQNWRWGELSTEFQGLWESYDRSFVALAAIECLIFRQALEVGRQSVDEANYMELDYGVLCAEPEASFRKVSEFCRLPWTHSFQKQVNAYRLVSTDYKWREDLTDNQQQIMLEIFDKYRHNLWPGFA